MKFKVWLIDCLPFKSLELILYNLKMILAHKLRTNRKLLRLFSSTIEELPSFLCSRPGEGVDILHAESNDILFNLATEEYMFEHLPLANPCLFLWRNTPTIIMGKHQNPWKECHVQRLEAGNVTLARRFSGGGCVY